MTVTLEGVRYVVDCGKHKTRDFNGTTGMESLTVKDVSKAQVRSLPQNFCCVRPMNSRFE
jgi:HrpA-like RNA helicase